MKFWFKGVLVAAVMAAASLASGSSFAQSPCPECGAQVAVKDIDPAIRKVVEEMGLERSTALLVGQMHTVEMVGNGTMVDLEAAQLGQPMQVSKVVWNENMQLHADRWTVTTAGSPDVIRVVKNGKAWNETWSADKKKLSTQPVSPEVAALRAQLVWFQPQGFITAAAYASGKTCLVADVAKKTCDNNTASVSQEGGKTVITLNFDGNTYKGTVSPTNRIASIEGNIKLPNGQTKKLTATYPSWRAGEVAEVPHDVAYGANALDKFHNGTYWPEKVTWDLDGTKVLDLTITEGWGNPYSAYPDPELLAKAQ